MVLSGTGVTNGETIMAIFSDDESQLVVPLNVNFEGLGSANVYTELNDTTNGIGTQIKPYEPEKEICVNGCGTGGKRPT